MRACAIMLAAGVILLIPGLSTAPGAAVAPAGVGRLTAKDEKVRLSACQDLLEERRQTIQSLLVILADPGRKPAEQAEYFDSNSSANLAIRVLGEMRATEAVPALVKWLSILDEMPLALTHAIGPEEIPAAAALICIGRPAELALLKKIRESGSGALNLLPCILVKMEGEKITKLILEDAIAGEKLAEARGNLEAALTVLRQKPGGLFQ
jgi:hypothetical protein